MEKLVDNEDFAIFDVGNRNGHTDYIDYLTWDEITKPVMVGKDKFHRAFIVIKMMINNKYPIMQTFFQRYTKGELWMGCGHAKPQLLQTSGGINNTQIELIKKILAGNEVVLEEQHKLECGIKEGDKVKLYIDIKENNAALILQKYWRLCRYNPEYQICRKITNNF